MKANKGSKSSLRCRHTHPCWPVQYLRDPHSQNVRVTGQVLAKHGFHSLVIQVDLKLLIEVEVVEGAGILLQTRNVTPALASVGLDGPVQSCCRRNKGSAYY